jgi:hypothetical protein
MNRSKAREAHLKQNAEKKTSKINSEKKIESRAFLFFATVTLTSR